MKILGIVQARMSSRRLYGKVMRPLGGKPLIWYLFERVKRSSYLSELILATSCDPSDDPLSQYCAMLEGVHVVRGSLDNVAERFHMTLQRYESDAFVRICGDSPLIDARLIDRGIEIFCSARQPPDLVTNIYPRSFPKGQSVEVFSSLSYMNAYALMTDPDEKEHLGSFFYKNSTRYNILNFSSPDGDYSEVRLCVDTEEDFQNLEQLLLHGVRVGFHQSWKEFVDLSHSQ